MLAIQRGSVRINVERVDIVRRLIEKVARFIEGHVGRDKDGDGKRSSQLVSVSKGHSKSD